jgi:uncharacterized integral membrane protein
MANFWLKLKIWTKGILFCVLFLYILLFVFFNQGNHAKLWAYPGKTIESTTLLVSLFAFVAGMIVIVLIRTTLVTARQVRELKERSRSAKLERAVQDMQNKAAMLRAKPSGTVTSEPETDTEGDGDETVAPH